MGQSSLLVKTVSASSRNRVILIRELGGQCVNPYGQHERPYEDLRALQIDHKAGNGNDDIKRFGPTMYKYYLEHLDEAKEKLQILCANCNWIKRSLNNENRKTRLQISGEPQRRPKIPRAPTFRNAASTLKVNFYTDELESFQKNTEANGVSMSAVIRQQMKRFIENERIQLAMTAMFKCSWLEGKK